MRKKGDSDKMWTNKKGHQPSQSCLSLDCIEVGGCGDFINGVKTTNFISHCKNNSNQNSRRTQQRLKLPNEGKTNERSNKPKLE